MSTHKVTVTREGKWWMVAIPEFDGLTQARRLGEVEEMARDWIALHLDVPVEEVAVDVRVDTVQGIEVAATLEGIEATRREAARNERVARESTIALAKQLAQAEVPVRDIGSILGVSFQRAHQLVTAESK